MHQDRERPLGPVALVGSYPMRVRKYSTRNAPRRRLISSKTLYRLGFPTDPSRVGRFFSHM